MTTIHNLPAPPWDMESAAARLQLLEDDFNLLNADTISDNYTDNAEVRIGTTFLHGKQEIKDFFTGDLAGKKGYKVKLDLWGALKGRMAVRYEAEWHDANERLIKTYGVQVFQYNEQGIIEMNFSSFNNTTVS